jgi:hypothetical protein
MSLYHRSLYYNQKLRFTHSVPFFLSQVTDRVNVIKSAHGHKHEAAQSLHVRFAIEDRPTVAAETDIPMLIIWQDSVEDAGTF